MSQTTAAKMNEINEIQVRGVRRYLPIAGRILLGLVFFVFGLNGFLWFLPAPTSGVPEGAMAFGMAMMKTGYLFQFLKGTEVLVGALLLANRFVPLALAVLTPIVLNIVAFHLFLEPSGLPLALVILALLAYQAWTYRAAYRPMLVGRAARKA